MLTAREAASAVGMTKQGIIRSIHTGKLSATRNANGQFEIDASELFRVYSPLPAIDTESSTGDKLSWEVAGNEVGHQSDGVVDQVTLLERIIHSHEETISDLRHQLAVATEEKQQLLAVVTTLTNQVAPPSARKSWWARLLGS